MVRLKKSQITLFILLGLIILFIFIAVFYISYRNIEFSKMDSSDFSEYMDACIKQYAEFSLYSLGFSGGDLSKAKKFEKQFTETSYSLYDGTYYYLEPDAVETQLENDVKSGIESCASKFPDGRYDVEIGEIEVDAKINEKDVMFDVTSDITISNEQEAKRYTKFSVKFDSSLHMMLDAMKKISLLYNDKDLFELYPYMDSLPFEIRILPYKDDSVLIYFIDRENLIAGKPYLFRFAML